MPLTQDQAAQLEEYEGYRSRVYKCTSGKDTIGIGYCLDANPLKLSSEELQSLRNVGIDHDKAVYYMKKVCNKIEIEIAKKLDWFDELDSNTKFVLIGMAYQMGVEGLLEFKKTLAFIKDKKYTDAGVEMLRSKWARQSPNRAVSMTNILKTGRIR